MKKEFFTLLLIVASVIFADKAQAQNAFHVSVNPGMVLESNQDKKFGLGGTLALMIEDRFMLNRPAYYVTFGVKGFNNPFGEGKLISSIFNKETDAFNYVAFLAGYRMTQDNFANGWYFEPRFGYAAGSGYGAFVLAPVGGYAYNNFDFGVFADLGFGGKESIIGNKNFYTLGLTIGYNIGF